MRTKSHHIPDCSRQAFKGWAAACGLGVLALALAARSWLAWPDPLIDFGRELYVPWRLVEGDRLYQDIAYFNGPLSPYLNALFFRLFGVGIKTLLLVNAVALAAIVALFYRVVSIFHGRGVAFVSCGVFLVVFGLLPVSLTSYNYLAPYSHEMTHSLLLGLASISCLAQYGIDRNGKWLSLSGVLTGAVLLTKPETALAVVTSSTIGVFLASRLEDGSTEPRSRWRSWLNWGGGFVLVPLVGLTLLASSIGIAGVWDAISTPYAAVLQGAVGGQTFYRFVSGTYDVGDSLRRIGIGLFFYAAYLGIPALAVDRLLKPPAEGSKTGVVILYGAVLLGFVATVLLLPPHVFSREPHPLQIIILLILAGEVSGRWPLLRNPDRPAATAPAAAAFGTLALVLLAKTRMRVLVYHYGFVLTAPAMVALLVVVFGGLPRYLRRKGRWGSLYQAFAAGIVAGLLVLHLGVTDVFLRRRTHVLGEGVDRMRVDPGRGSMVDEAMAAVRDHQPIRTLAVLPEGVTINYMLRTPASTPFTTFLPLELSLFGEETHLQAFSANPPDGILVWNRQAWFYGEFGRDYGSDIARWVGEEYEEVWSAETIDQDRVGMIQDTFRIRLLLPR